jgi:RNA polymerase sigma factor for flagellar operon FliA
MTTIHELWQSYREAPNEALRHQLIEQYAPLARYVVDRLHFQPTGGISYEDLLGQAILGLIEAVDRFDPARGVKFNTFAYYRIRGAVMDMLREMDWVPRSLRAKSTDLVNTMSRLEAELGRPATDDEVAAALHISLEEFDALAQEIGTQTVVSMDEVLESASGDSGVSVRDTLVDDSAVLPDAYTEMQDQRRRLAEAIDALPKNERLVISLYYYDGLTLKEIGKVLGVTESRACQLHSKAVLRLRAAMQGE